jgi:ComEC/Rec2-related protein
MRRPAVGAGIAFAVGVGVSLIFTSMVDYQAVWLCCAIGIWLLALLFYIKRKSYGATVAVYATIAMVGLMVGMRSTASVDFDAWFDSSRDRVTDCTIAGVVCRDADETAGRPMPNRTYFEVDVDTVVLAGVTNAVSESVHITLFGTPSQPPAFGERWQLTGNLYRNEWQGHTQWRFRGGLRETVRAKAPTGSVLVMAHACRRQASKILTYGIEGNPSACGVVQALLLGYRTRLDRDLKHAFARTGTMHIFAISGLHVAILCSVLIFVVSLAGVSRTGWFFVLSPMIILYAIATGSRASAIRAGVMASAYLLGPALKRRPDGMSALAIAGIGILCWRPDQLFEVGFIFSFMAVAGILMIVPALDTFMMRWLAPDPLAVGEWPLRASWWREAMLWIGRLATVSLSAWLTTMPLSLYYFGRLAPIALVANLLVVPLAFLIIITGCLSLVSASTMGPWLVELFNHANAVFVQLLIGGMKWLEAIPYGHIEDLEVPRIMIAVWYVMLVYVALLLRDLSARQSARARRADHGRQPRSSARNV